MSGAAASTSHARAWSARAWSVRVFVNLLYPTLPRGVCVFYQSVRPSPLVKFGRRAMAGSSFSALLRAVARAPVLCLLSECVVATGVVARAALACFTAGPFSRSALEVCRRFSRQRSRLPVPFCASRPRLAHPRASRCAFARSSRAALVSRALASTLLFALVDRRRRHRRLIACAPHMWQDDFPSRLCDYVLRGLEQVLPGLQALLQRAAVGGLPLLDLQHHGCARL